MGQCPQSAGKNPFHLGDIEYTNHTYGELENSGGEADRALPDWSPMRLHHRKFFVGGSSYYRSEMPGGNANERRTNRAKSFRGWDWGMDRPIARTRPGLRLSVRAAHAHLA